MLAGRPNSDSGRAVGRFVRNIFFTNLAAFFGRNLGKLILKFHNTLNP